MRLNLVLAFCLYAMTITVSQGQGFGNQVGPSTGPTFEQSEYSVHTGYAIHCSPDGCIASGPYCNTTAIPGQCMFPAGTDQWASCTMTPGCVAITCNAASGECYARSVTDLTPMEGFNSMVPKQQILFSDIRLKTSIERVGTTVRSLPLYRFNYIDRDGRYEGVMAQDVIAVMPEAVIMGADGYYRVNYTRLGQRMRRVD